MSYILDDDGKKYYSPATYIQRYYEELFTNLLEKSYDNNLISHNELFVDYVKSRKDISSYYVMTLSIIADTEEDIYYDMTDVYYSDKVEYALGEDLDDIGLRVGCPRPQATRPSAELTFSIVQASTSSLIIPKDTVVSTKNGVSYYTSSEVVIPIGETNVTVLAYSVKPGWSNRVPSGSLTIIETEFDEDNLKVTNLLSSSGGRDEYDDESYRELLMEWVENNTKGSNASLKRYFANVDGLDGYKLLPNWDGSGTLKIVLDPGEDTQLKKVYDEVKEYVCQFDDDITMSSPVNVPIKVYAVCNIDIDVVNPYSRSEKEEIKSKIKDVIWKFVNGDIYDVENRKVYTGLKIGEDFIPYKLGVFVANQIPELKNIVFKYPTEPVTITDEEIGVIESIDDITIDME